MNCCICGRYFWHIKFLGGGGAILCQRLVLLLFWGCIPYVIHTVPWIVWFTIWIIHVVPIMLYPLAYLRLLLLSLVWLAVCGCSQILQIYLCRLIVRDELLIDGVYLEWLLILVVISPTIGGGSIDLRCIVPVWNGFQRMDGSLCLV